MRRRSSDASSSGGDRRPVSLIFLFAAFVTCCLVYTTFFMVHRRSLSSVRSQSSADAVERFGAIGEEEAEDVEARGECCRGVENMELWGSSVKWGSDFRFNTSRDCCKACKDMCHTRDGPCLCDSWVFCGDKERCQEKFGQCWLKKQDDPMFPEVAESGENVIWTSGIIFGKREGIVSLETEHGTIRIKLFPECAPSSMGFITELLKLQHSVGCHFYRAETRGDTWDELGNYIENAPLGPPYGLIQGTLAAEGILFKKLPKEACPFIDRGAVAWIDSGPEFFISLANHHEWHRSFTVFGAVVPDDMSVAEAIAKLPTKPEEWSGVKVRVLEKPVQFKVKRLRSHESES